MQIVKYIGFLFFLILYLLLEFPVEYFPGTTFLLILAYCLPKLFFKNSKRVFKSFEKYYFTFFSINVLFALFNSYVSFQKGSVEYPWIWNSDPETYYNMARDFSNNNTFDLTVLRGLYVGYPLMMGIIFKIFGTFLPIGLMFNIMAANLLFILTLRLGLFFSKDEKNLRLISIFLLISPHILSLGSIFLKDVWVSMGMVGAILCIFYLMEKYSLKYLLWLFLCLIIIGLMRGVYLVIPLLLPLFVKPLKNLRLNFILVGLIYLAYLIVSDINPYLKDLSDVYETNVAGDYGQKWESSGLTNRLLGGYFNWTFIKKILFIPITLIIQLIQPYQFWDLNFDYPWRFLQRTMMGVWLIFLLPKILLTLLKKRNALKMNKQLKGLFLWALAAFLIPVYLYGGTIPRYGTPFISFFFIVTSCLITFNKSNYGLDNNQ